MAAHRFWKLHIASITSGSYSHLAELKLQASPGGPQLAGVPGEFVEATAHTFDAETVPSGWTSNVGLIFKAAPDAEAGTAKALTFDGPAGDDGLGDNADAYIEIPFTADPLTADAMLVRYWTQGEHTWDGFSIQVDGTTVFTDKANRSGFLTAIVRMTLGAHTIRLRYTSDWGWSGGFQNVRFSKVAFGIPPGSGFSSPIYDWPYGPEKAFDADGNTLWHSNGSGAPFHVGWDFGADPQDIGAITLRSRPDGWGNQMARSGALMWSDDGVNYSTAFDFETDDWGSAEERTFFASEVPPTVHLYTANLGVFHSGGKVARVATAFADVLHPGAPVVRVDQASAELLSPFHPVVQNTAAHVELLRSISGRPYVRRQLTIVNVF